MIHGDLKGVLSQILVITTLLNALAIKANILIDQNVHACLADFGLLTIVSDCTRPTTSSSLTNAGTARWMSPELLDPDRFGFKNSRRTKESDCYALGMVILEVLSGQTPFPGYIDLVVTRKVTEGERPGKPQGAKEMWFTDDLWRMLNQCWSPQPKDRPIIEVVFECLERVSTVWQPLPTGADEDVQSDSDDESLLTVSYPCIFPRFIANLTRFEEKITEAFPSASQPPMIPSAADSFRRQSPGMIVVESMDTSGATPNVRAIPITEPMSFASLPPQQLGPSPMEMCLTPDSPPPHESQTPKSPHPIQEIPALGWENPSLDMPGIFRTNSPMSFIQDPPNGMSFNMEFILRSN